MDESAPAPTSRPLLDTRRRHLALMLGYGFVAGLPLPLSGFALRQWLTEGGMAVAVIGLTANLSLAYTLKPLWAPVLDNVAPPWVLARFGRRRGWLLAIQPLLVAAAVLLAFSRPEAHVGVTLAAAALVAFLSASQDIVVDAWRIEAFAPRAQGAALAAYIWGYRAALLVAGSGAIWAAVRAGWPAVLIGVAVLIGIGPLVTLLAPEPEAPRDGAQEGAALAMRLRHALVEPLQDFLKRRGAALILAFVALFRLGEAMAGIMTTPFYRSLGFVPTQVAATGLYSLGAAIAGYSLGGLLVARFGVGRALLATGFGQTVAMAMYLVLAYSPGSSATLYATVATETFAQGMADAAFLTFLSRLCSRAFTATQYALLSSVAVISSHTIGGLSGFLAEALGWKGFYAVAMGAAMPSMVLMVILLRRQPDAEPVPA